MGDYAAVTQALEAEAEAREPSQARTMAEKARRHGREGRAPAETQAAAEAQARAAAEARVRELEAIIKRLEQGS